MKRFKLIALAFAGTVLTASTYAQGYLLTINDSNPSAVVFTATTNSSTVNNMNTTTGNGIDLLNFFNASAAGQFSGTAGSGTLMGGASGQSYTSFALDNFSGSSVDLNLFMVSGTASQSFSSTAPAFTGSWTINFSSMASLLPTGGTTGYLRSGTSNSGGVVIGQWQVLANPVPEPGTLALASLGGVAAFFLARRRK